jgi:hypothetical protein
MCVFGGSSGGIRNEKRSQRTISKPAASISAPVQRQRGHGAVEGRVGDREPLGQRVDEGHGNRRARRLRDGKPAQVPLGLHRHDLVHGRRVATEVQPVAGPDLQHAARQSVEQLCAPGGEAEPFGLDALACIQPRAHRMVDGRERTRAPPGESLERRSQFARFVRRDAARLPADLRDTLYDRLVEQPYRLVVDWLRQRLPEDRPAPDLYPLALILVEPMASYRSIRHTFDRVPDDIDDERFIAAWVDTALAVARHYRVHGA